jgi:hypothetical protein
VAEAILGLDHDGTMVHDGWSPYDQFEHARHQQCLNHRLRRSDEMAATAARGDICFSRRVPPRAEVVDAVAIHGGELESYDFHRFEVLQSLVKARKGGEPGIARVEFLHGDALWEAMADGRCSKELAEAAMATELGKKPATLKSVEGEKEAAPHGILLTYKDGFRATVLKIGRNNTRWNFACRLKGDKEVKALRYSAGPWKNRNLFKALAHAFQHMVRTGKPPCPVERTLLANGVLDAAMHSRAEGRGLATPHLEFSYKPVDFRALRETGASWKVVTEETPELPGIRPNGGKKP